MGFGAIGEVLILCAAGYMGLRRLKLIVGMLQLADVTEWLRLGTECN